jgi:hypothetical protein
MPIPPIISYDIYIVSQALKAAIHPQPIEDRRLLAAGG